ncbi:MAG TPA: hypothetical protein VGG72_11500 [Bryobacteraceae bacterium]|jgi:hypothetical protein
MRIALLICGLLFWAVDAAAQDICEAVNPAPPCVGAVAPGDTQISVHAATGATNGAIGISVKLTRAGGAESMTIPAAPTGTGLYAAGVTPALDANDMIAVQVASSTQPAITLGPIFVPAANTSTLYVLGLVGINATGASSSGASQQYFAEFDMIAPWNCRDGQVAHALQHKCWLWLNPRIASVPSASSTALTTLGSSASSLAGGLTSKTAGQIAQTMEFQGGVEFYLRSPWEGAQFGRNHSWDRTAISFIAGGGVVTPFSPASSAPEFALNANAAQQFNQNPTLASLYPQLASALCNYGFTGANCSKTPASAGPSIVAFVPPARSRFYRDFYAGIRLRTFFLKGACPDPSLKVSEPACKLDNTFPGYFDVRFGEDETVTAGRLVPLVMTLAASYPLPGTSGSVRVFGSVYLRLHASQNSNPLLLLPSASYATLDQPSVVVQPVAPSDQDYYRVGLGVDLIPLIAKWAGTN